MHTLKRLIISIIYLVGMLIITACNAEKGSHQMDDSYYRIAGELIVDAVPDAEMFGHEMYADDMVKPFYSSAVTRQGNRAAMGFPLPRIPEKVRVIWRKKGVYAQVRWGSAAYYDSNGKDISKPGFIPAPLSSSQEVQRRKEISKNTGVPHYGPWGSKYRDELAGDYTILVASRIPEAVLEEVRKNGGALRIKFRLKPDGVMLGWDIQRTHKSGHGFVYSDAGGDFLDTLY